MIPPVSLEHRRLLGHHMDAKNTSALTYSRDAMSAPLQVMEEVLEAVRKQILKPDDTGAERAAAARSFVVRPATGIDQDAVEPDEFLREDFPEVETDSGKSGSSLDDMNDELDDQAEASSFEVLGRCQCCRS
jgi:hypothetical protein